jgi:hypothetical protein
MKQVLVAVALAASLSGCMSVQDWSEAPMAPAGMVGAPPGPWWGQDVASVAVFDAVLSPYGTWGTHSRFGRVFLPSGIGPDWQPYTRGQWVRDPRFGTVFAGADPWGWATYHYGRWGRDDRFGWYWIPDTRFAPPVGLAGAAGGWQAGQADWNRWNGGWNGGWGAPWGGGWGSPWGPGWNAGWHPGWNAGWGSGWGRWNNGWGGGWGPGWHPGWNDRHWRDRDRDRRRDRDRDRDPDWVDRTRPGESPMAGFVRNRVPPPAPQGQPAATAPPNGWAAPWQGQRRPDAPRGDSMRGDASGGGAMGGFVRNRTQPVAAPGFGRAPAEARPQPERVMVAPPPRAEAPSYRAERAQPSYERSQSEMSRSREPYGREAPRRVADD